MDDGRGLGRKVYGGYEGERVYGVVKVTAKKRMQIK